MGGDSGGKALPATSPPISLPYVDMTLQVRDCRIFTSVLVHSTLHSDDPSLSSLKQ